MELTSISLGIILGILLSPFHSLIHEIGHCIGIYISNLFCKKFNRKIINIIYISKSNGKTKFQKIRDFIKTSGFTFSNFFIYLKKDTTENKNLIRLIAISGSLFSLLFSITIIYLSILLATNYSPIFFIFAGIFAFFIFREILSSIIIGKNDIFPDIHFFLHPELFEYHPNKKDKIEKDRWIVIQMPTIHLS